MADWDFREYQSGTGKLPVSKWYGKLSEKNRAEAGRLMGIAQKLDRLEWPYFGKFQQLLEARWAGENKVPHRIFCYVPSGSMCVIFLCGCTHKGRRYNPPSAYKTALKRRNEIEGGRASTHAFDF